MTGCGCAPRPPTDQTSPRREEAPSRPQARLGMWYLSSWRDLRRRSTAGHGLGNKPEITPPSHSYHSRDGTGTVEPKFKVPDRPSKLDPFADKLSGWLRIEAGQSRKQKRTA